MVHRFQDVSTAFKSSKTLSQLGSMFGPENVIRAQGSTGMVQAALMKQGVTGFQLTSRLAESRSIEEMAHGLENRVSVEGYRTLFDKTSAKFRDDVLGKGAGARIDTEVEALRRLKLEQEIQSSNRLRSNLKGIGIRSLDKELRWILKPVVLLELYPLGKSLETLNHRSSSGLVVINLNLSQRVLSNMQANFFRLMARMKQ